jgi:hypothetical protein
MADGDLSDEQLKQLLKDAELRLKEAKPNQALQTQDFSFQRKYVKPLPHLPSSSSFLGQLSNIWHSIPKVASKTQITPYISSTSRGARVEPSHMVNAAERKLSSGVRTVQDPVEVKAKADQVRLSPYTTPEEIFDEENLSQKNMTQNSAPSWVLPCNK